MEYDWEAMMKRPAGEGALCCRIDRRNSERNAMRTDWRRDFAPDKHPMGVTRYSALAPAAAAVGEAEAEAAYSSIVAAEASVVGVSEEDLVVEGILEEQVGDHLQQGQAWRTLA